MDTFDYVIVGAGSAGGRLSRAKVSTCALGPSAAAPFGAGWRGDVDARPNILLNMVASSSPSPRPYGERVGVRGNRLLRRLWPPLTLTLSPF